MAFTTTQVAILLALLTVANSVLGVVYLNGDGSATSAFQCLAKAGYTDASAIILSSGKQIENGGLDSLTKAKSTFSNVSLLYLGCPSRNTQAQVKELMTKIPKEVYNQLYIMPFNFEEDACQPVENNPKQNCRRLLAYLTEFDTYRVKPGILAEADLWATFFGTSCPEAGKYPLYWIPYDNAPTFDNFVPFGPFTSKPSIKDYHLETGLCGTLVELSYRP